ncbi:MAG: hypothetical protein JNJ77_20145 [Planctomycetia bacterium]|nr:hypothetical protein [Planctomycetia bacterium]
MRVRKELLRIGKHHTKNGVLNATPEFIDQRIAQFRQLKEKGVKVPVAWGHNSQALPLDPHARQDEQRFHQSKYKAGDLLDLVRVEDKVYMEAEIPAVKRVENGNLIHDVEVDGQKKEAAISEVSAGFFDWTDGQGELHKDALIHVALCPLPVAMGQEGFQPAAQPVLLSTSTWFGAIDANGSTEPRKPKHLGTDMDDEKKQTEPEATDTPEATEKEKEKPSTSKPVSELFKEIGEKLKIGLPDKVPGSAEEALELLHAAACVIAGPAQEDELVDAPNPANGTASGMMLSTAIKEKGWAGQAARNLDASTREGLKARIEALKKRGLSDDDYKDFLGQVPKLELSVNPDDGKVIDTHLHRLLTFAERNLPKPHELATDTELTDVPNPTTAAAEAKKARDEAVEKQRKEWGID